MTERPWCGGGEAMTGVSTYKIFAHGNSALHRILFYGTHYCHVNNILLTKTLSCMVRRTLFSHFLHPFYLFLCHKGILGLNFTLCISNVFCFFPFLFLVTFLDLQPQKVHFYIVEYLCVPFFAFSFPLDTSGGPLLYLQFTNGI